MAVWVQGSARSRAAWSNGGRFGGGWAADGGCAQTHAEERSAAACSVRRLARAAAATEVPLEPVGPTEASTDRRRIWPQHLKHEGVHGSRSVADDDDDPSRRSARGRRACRSRVPLKPHVPSALGENAGREHVERLKRLLKSKTIEHVDYADCSAERGVTEDERGAATEGEGDGGDRRPRRGQRRRRTVRRSRTSTTRAGPSTSTATRARRRRANCTPRRSREDDGRRYRSAMASAPATLRAEATGRSTGTPDNVSDAVL